MATSAGALPGLSFVYSIPPQPAGDAQRGIEIEECGQGVKRAVYGSEAGRCCLERRPYERSLKPVKGIG